MSLSLVRDAAQEMGTFDICQHGLLTASVMLMERIAKHTECGLGWENEPCGICFTCVK